MASRPRSRPFCLRDQR